MSLSPDPIRIVLYEGPGAEPLGAEERFDVVRTLLESGHAVTHVDARTSLPHLDPTNLLVLGRFAENTPPSFGQTTTGSPIRCQPLGSDPPTLPAQIEIHRAALAAPAPTPWIPWFPVIDYDRCVDCQQCLGFCLFGVFGLDEHRRIQVQNQDQCKTLCPACARVCPQAAILFPKHAAGPINGDKVNEADLERETIQVNLATLFGGDAHTTLRARSERAQSRFSKERNANQALSERQRCLQQLGRLAADIPPEVLRGLPSPEEIARRAAEAAARAGRPPASA